MYYFIWNPAAGKGESERALPVIKLFMDERGLQYTLLKTERAGHAAELAKKAAEDPEAMAVVAIGGDGTILETASGLIDADLPLACIPLGNGNDFMSNIIDLRKYRTVEEKTKRCLEILLRGQRGQHSHPPPQHFQERVRIRIRGKVNDYIYPLPGCSIAPLPRCTRNI